MIRKELETLPLNILKGGLKQETRLEMGKRANEPQMLVDHLVDPSNVSLYERRFDPFGCTAGFPQT